MCGAAVTVMLLQILF